MYFDSIPIVHLSSTFSIVQNFTAKVFIFPDPFEYLHPNKIPIKNEKKKSVTDLLLVAKSEFD